MDKSLTSEVVKILLVDDLKDNLLALEGLLKRDGIEIFTAKSGVEALECMISHEFAVALVDVQMPGMSGFELAALMRGAKMTKGIPIIFVTATANDSSFSFRGYESGGVDFLFKPLDTHVVRSKVNVFIDLYRQKSELRHQLATIAGLVEALHHAKDEAEKANTAKTQFLANVSHELRTPLSAILGYSELLANPEQLKSDALYCSNGIQRNIEQLTELIDEILDISKMEAGKFEVDRVRFELLPELGEIFIPLRDRAKVKGLALGVTFDGEIPEFICACPKRLRQILLNLVGNALKFTDHGSINIVVKLVPQRTESGVLLHFAVTDTGCGLSAEQQLRLFRPFGQADSSVTRKYGGTGLGLVLARRLAEALGGDVALTASKIGEGSIFTLSLDPGGLAGVSMLKGLSMADLKSRPAAPIELVRAGQRLAGLKILLAEDGPDNQILMRRFLETSGAFVALAGNGTEALRLAADNVYDIVLMDMQMPIIDGYAATKQLRAGGYTVPIVALTANAMRGERETCLAAGCVDYLSKPVKGMTLIDTIERLIKGGSGSTEMSTRSSMADDPLMRQLLVTFVQALPQRMMALRSAEQQSDLIRLSTLAHQLSGACGGYGFPEMGKVAAAIEVQANDRQSPEVLATLIAELGALCDSAARGITTEAGGCGRKAGEAAIRMGDL